jgi:hypothetical protein
MKTSLILLVASVLTALSLASFAGSAKAAPCSTGCGNPFTTLASIRHDMLKSVVQNLRS